MQRDDRELLAIIHEYGIDCRSEEIDSVTYHVDVVQCEENQWRFKYIDIDFINGEFLEINEGDKIYQKLKDIFSFQETDSETYQVLYQSNRFSK